MSASILVVDFVGVRFGFEGYYYMLADSHKFLALTCAISAFLFFKNLNIKQNRIVNVIASSTFGILLIHANSDTMRRFLWKDLFRNTAFYNSPMFMMHAVIVVVATYVVCLFIDQLRIRFIEPPFYVELTIQDGY